MQVKQDKERPSHKLNYVCCSRGELVPTIYKVISSTPAQTKRANTLTVVVQSKCFVN